MGAPVCLVNPPSPIPEPIQRLLPSVPPATDLASALAAINALRQIVYMLINALPPNGLVNGRPIEVQGLQGLRGTAGAPGSSATKTKSTFKQSDIVQADVTIPVRDEDGNQIGTAVVSQVNQLVMTNPVTQETWTFQRNG